MSYLRMIRNKKKKRKYNADKKEFKRGKVCEMCKRPERQGKPNKLTIHNHNLPKKFWVVLCRKCHDKVHGIVRNGKNEIIAWYKGDNLDWYCEQQGWYG